MRASLLTALSFAAFATPRVLVAQRATMPIVPKARDSAGVRILDHAADALDRAPLLSFAPIPLAIIGKNDTTLDLSGVRSEVLVMRDGSIVFFAGRSVQVASPDGTRLQRIGRDGAGPREFRSGDISRGRGDTILVTDLDNSRIAWVTPSQGVIRTRALVLNRSGYGFGAMAQFAHDTLIMGNSFYRPQFTKPGNRVPFPIGLLTDASDSIRVLLPLEGGEMRAGGSFGSVAVRYPPNPVAAPWGDGFLAVRPDRWKLDRFRANGTLATSVRVPVRSIAVTPQLHDRDVDDMLAMMQRRSKTPIDIAKSRATFNGFPYPDSLPAFEDAETTAGGIAWVRAMRWAADTTWAYTAVALDGRILGRLEGHGHRPVAFGDDRVVLYDEDSDGLVTWRVMRVDWKHH